MENFKKITEQTSEYRHLEKMSVTEILRNINNEDITVPLAVERSIPKIEKTPSSSAMTALTPKRPASASPWKALHTRRNISI